ncbi:MAG: hypothetical protein HY719_03635 [Planctomycetes bacterium]|nr:hypothetical protein [Planctomycetota bacterium]
MPPSGLSSVPAPIAAVISRTRGAVRFVAAVEGAALLATVILGGTLGALWVDHVASLSAGWRAALLAVLLLASAFVVWRRLVGPLSRRRSDEAVAARLEEHLPDLDGALVSAVEFSRLSGGGLTAALRAEAVKIAAQGAGAVDRRRAVNPRRAKQLALAAGGLLLLGAAYGAWWPDHFRNGLLRLALPAASIDPITATRLEVKPGDVTVPRGDDVLVTATPSGDLPPSAAIEYRLDDAAPDAESAAETAPMRFEGAVFLHSFPAIERGLSYRVLASDAVTRWYQVTVVERPAVKRIETRVAPPAYARIPEQVNENASADLRAVKGSSVTLLFTASEGVERMEMRSETRLLRDGAQRLRAAFVLDDTVRYTLRLTDGHGVSSAPGRQYSLEAFTDGPPAAAITSGAREREIPRPAPFAVNVLATDDVGLLRVTLLAALPGGSLEPVAEASPAPGTLRYTGTLTLPLEGLSLRPGDAVTYLVEVTDGHPDGSHTVRTPEHRVRLVSGGAKRQESLDALVNLQARLARLIEMQTKNRREASRFQEGLAVIPAAQQDRLRETVPAEQERIRAEASRAAGEVKGDSPFETKVRDGLVRLTVNEMADAAAAAARLPREKARPATDEALRALAPLQDRILEKLKALLEVTKAGAATLKKTLDLPAEFSPEDPRVKDRAAAAEHVRENLKDFIDKQREVVEATKALMGKEPDDFTAGDKAKVQELSKAEQDLARFLEDLKDDLSRLPNADHTDSTQVKEVVEAFEEIDRDVLAASNALDQQSVEMAVPLEQSGLEKAESLEHNLERWLPQGPDRQQWNMEDPPGEMEIPLVDLPEELEDLIGDLMEQEEDLADDAQDVSSKWMDSIDEGAGWEAGDGPISNMSARGVTGNQLPNEHEISGRSGEGRSGRSHGQFVEEEATGKGGRKTPTRVTNDPYEKGSVKDSSTDPTGGATGGGKVSGGGELGLRGVPPPPVKEMLDRLASRQAELHQKAERMEHTLKKYQYPAESMAGAAKTMKGMESDLAAARLDDFQAKRKVLAKELEESKGGVGEQIRTDRERGLKIPRSLRDELSRALDEETPAAYRDELREYYRRLAGAGSEGK